MASVDVVIPNYNYARFLPDCVRSALAQDVDDLRVVIIDNASSDNSVDVARRLADEDPRVELVCHETNKGQNGSFNKAIDLARADYFMILCSDDLLAAGALSRAVDFLEEHPEAILAIGPETNVESHLSRSNDGPVSWDIVDGEQFIEKCCRLLGHGFGFGAMLVRTGAQKEAGHYSASLPYTDDLEMLLRLAHLGAVAETDAPLGVRREHETNMSKLYCNTKIRDLREREAAFRGFVMSEPSDVRSPSPLLPLARRCLAESAYWSAVSHMFRGRASESLELFRYGFRLSPAAMLVPPVGHLFRMRGALRRVADVISESLRIRPLPVSESAHGPDRG